MARSQPRRTLHLATGHDREQPTFAQIRVHAYLDLLETGATPMISTPSHRLAWINLWISPPGLVLGAIRGIVRSTLLAPDVDESQPAVPGDGATRAGSDLPGSDAPASDPPELPARGRRLSVPWQRLGFFGALLLSAFLNLRRLDREGNANQYYTATV